MQKTAPYFTKREAQGEASAAVVSLFDLERLAEDWVVDSEYRNHSPRTIEAKRHIAEKLLWFLQHRDFE